MVITLLFFSFLHIVAEEEEDEDEESTTDYLKSLFNKYLKGWFEDAERCGKWWARTYDAPKYKPKYQNYTLGEKIQDTINWGCILNAAAGLIGEKAVQNKLIRWLKLKSLLKLVTKWGLGPAFAISIALQVVLISAVATFYKLNLYDSRVWRFAIAVLVGDFVAEKFGKPVMYNIGMWLSAKEIIGVFFSFVADGGICAVAATQGHPLIYGTQLVPRDPLHEWLAEKKLSPIAKTLTDDGWNDDIRCDITEAHLERLNIKSGYRTSFMKANKDECHSDVRDSNYMLWVAIAILVMIFLYLSRCRVHARLMQLKHRIRAAFMPVEGAGAGAEVPVPGQ